ncbi:MAG: hypothetical protein DIU52_006385 [bacterium]|nr:MAG: hypothetical protein DIU52_05550 [bacterium]
MRARPRRGPRRAALGAALLAALLAALACAVWGVAPFAAPEGAAGVRRARVSDAAAEARGAAVAPDAADAVGTRAERPSRPRRSTLAPTRPDAPATFLAAPGITLEPVSEREGPQARLRARGFRVIRGAPPLRLELNPEAPRVLSRKLAHLDAMPALLRARAGIVPSRSTPRPPPSPHSS